MKKKAPKKKKKVLKTKDFLERVGNDGLEYCLLNYYGAEDFRSLDDPVLAKLVIDTQHKLVLLDLLCKSLAYPILGRELYG